MPLQDDTNRYSVSPTTTASAYASGDAFGVATTGKKFSPDGVRGARIKHIDAILKGSVAVPLDVYIFSGTMTTTPVADNSVQAIHANDLGAKLIGRFVIAAADWVAIPGASGSAFSVHKDIPEIFIGGAGDYTVMITVHTGGPFTPSVANALYLSFVADQAEDALS